MVIYCEKAFFNEKMALTKWKNETTDKKHQLPTLKLQCSAARPQFIVAYVDSTTSVAG